MPRTLSPPTVTEPESAGRRPDRIPNKVDLPDPVEPTIETNSPSSTERLTPFNTSRVLVAETKDFETFRTSTNANFTYPLANSFETRRSAGASPQNPSF